MSKKEKTPDLVFGVSWEVCNRIGGIYTVLSTQAKALGEQLNGNLIYIGPDFGNSNELFTEEPALYEEWIANCKKETRISVRAGKWNVPGSPKVFLINHKEVEDELNDFLFDMWKNFQVDSLNAYGDYNESVLFGYASAKVIESFQAYYKLKRKKKGGRLEYELAGESNIWSGFRFYRIPAYLIPGTSTDINVIVWR